MGRRALAAIAALGVLGVLGVAVAGCDDPEPRLADPTSSGPATEPTSDTPEPSPTETVTSEPPEPESAQEFLRRWQDAANEMQVSGDTRQFEALNKKCEACDRFASNVRQIYADGGFIETQGSSIKRIEKWGAVNDWPTYDVRVQTQPSRYTESEGDEIKRLPGGQEVFRVSLEKTGRSWLVRRYTRVIT